VPSREEVSNCSPWLDRELTLLRPQLLIPVGKLAIGRFLEVRKLDALIGRVYRYTQGEVAADLIALPHPSGASVWHRVEPGKTLLRDALAAIATHPAWRALLDE